MGTNDQIHGRIHHIVHRFVGAGYKAIFDENGFVEFVQNIVQVPSIMIGPFEKA